MLILSSTSPKAVVLLLAGGHGGLQIFPNGSMRWGEGNFLIRSRHLFADQGLMVAVIDAPSDRQSSPFLAGFRQSGEHVADIKAAIAWLRTTSGTPVWLVGTSRGTQSAAHAAIELPGAEGPDGVVLSATILSDKRSRPVPSMALDRIRVPVLVVHHERDGCAYCSFSDIPLLMAKLKDSPRQQLLSFTDGQNEGDPCEARSYHGFNGIESIAVQQVASWILAK